MPGARSPPGSFHDPDIILFGNLFLISVVSLAMPAMTFTMFATSARVPILSRALS